MARSPAPLRIAAVLLATLVVCAGAPDARSAELAARVLDGDGVGLPDVVVSLLRVGPVPGAAGIVAEGPGTVTRPPFATTDLSGRAFFPDLGPGVYRVVFPGGGLEERWLLKPPEGEALFTLPDERAQVELTLVLRRGDRLVVTIETDESSHACASIELVEQALGGEVAFSACSRRGASRIVPPGRWTVTATGQDGAMFESLEIDGVTTPGASGEFEVTVGGRTHFLQLRYGSGCSVSGRARWNVGDSPPASICARLVAPGPQLASALAAGEKQPDHACFPLSDSGNWIGRVADGSWTIAPEGERLLASDPPSAAFECRAREVGRFDFELRVRDEEETDKLYVKVVSASGEPVNDATVELFPSDAGPLDAASPLSLTRSVGREGVSVFLRTPRRELVAVASHRVYGDGQLDLGLRRGHVVLELERRASLVILATGPDDAPFRGVELAVDALDGEPARSASTAATPASAWHEHRGHRRVVTDASGRATLEGLRPGRWRARPSVTGPDAARWLASILLEANEAVPETVLDVPESGQLPLTIRVAPASTVELRLACDDHGKVPMRASIALLEPHADAPWRDGPPIGRLEAATTLDGLPLGGPQLDRLVAGPLPAGSFVVAIRPEGFDRWTFAPGTEDPARAGVLSLNEGEALDLGAWELNCRPSILLVPEWREPEEASRPDISRAEVALELAPAGLAPTGVAHRQPLGPVLRLTGLDPGRFAASIAVTDRLLLPTAARPEGDGSVVLLERGRELVRRVAFDARSGSLDVATDAPAVRLRDAAGTSVAVLLPATDGVFRAGPLPAGTYRVETCRDATCEAPGRPLGEAVVVVGDVTSFP